MDQLLALIPADVLAYITAAISIVAIIMTVMPKPASDTGFYAVVYKALNFVAMNFGKAKNAA
jgi:Mg2+/citrate symporter